MLTMTHVSADREAGATYSHQKAKLILGMPRSFSVEQSNLDGKYMDSVVKRKDRSVPSK